MIAARVIGWGVAFSVVLPVMGLAIGAWVVASFVRERRRAELERGLHPRPDETCRVRCSGVV